MVYVLNSYGQPLMPTKRHGKIRRMLNSGRAKVIKRCPFTIQLLYVTTGYTQPVSLGIDAGSKHIGVSATTKDKVLYEADVTLRNDISDLLTARRQFRHSRRNRKLRYRKPRFNNRVHSKNKGWLAPSVQHKVDTHLQVIANIHKFLPISSITVEVASFDTQLVKAQLDGTPLPEGIDYQQGELLDWNLREYVFFRDNYECQWCHGKSKDKVLHTHHWNYWRGDHTNKPDSLITLCGTCNDSPNHKPDGFLYGWEPKITHNFKDVAFMGIMRWTLYNKLKELYPEVHVTYGYITKNTRIRAGLPKEHYTDARCISGNPEAETDGIVYFQKKVRRHNRQIHKANFSRGHVRKRNTALYLVKGFRLFDKVSYQGQEGFIFGRRSSGYFDLRTLDGIAIHRSASWKQLRLLEPARGYITEIKFRASVTHSSPTMQVLWMGYPA